MSQSLFTRFKHLLGGLLAATTLAYTPATLAEKPPPVIRIGVAMGAAGNPPVFTLMPIGIAHTKGWLQQEFQADGSKVEVIFFKGLGPAVNEALTGNKLDLALQGDLPSLIGQAGGLKTRLLAVQGRQTNIYLAVPPDSPIRSVKDVRGKRVGLAKGTNLQLPVDRLLADNGLTERDFKSINLDIANGVAALASKDVDAVFGGPEMLLARDKGFAKLVFSSKGGKPDYVRNSHILGTESFVRQYPDTTKRVLKVLIKTAQWASEDSNRDEVFALWGRMGITAEQWREEIGSTELKAKLSPLFDPFIVARYQAAAADAQQHKLIRRSVDINGWIDRQYLDAALAELKLQHYWAPLDIGGKPLTTQLTRK